MQLLNSSVLKKYLFELIINSFCLRFQVEIWNHFFLSIYLKVHGHPSLNIHSIYLYHSTIVYNFKLLICFDSWLTIFWHYFYQRFLRNLLWHLKKVGWIVFIISFNLFLSLESKVFKKQLIIEKMIKFKLGTR